MSEHTRLPWELHGQGTPLCGGAGPHDWVIVGDRHECLPDEDDEGGDPEDEPATSVVVVAHVKGNATAGDIPKQNAELIVRAVNAHEALVAALKRILAHECENRPCMVCADWARGALAAAKGGAP